MTTKRKSAHTTSETPAERAAAFAEYVETLEKLESAVLAYQQWRNSGHPRALASSAEAWAVVVTALDNVRAARGFGARHFPSGGR